MQNVVPELNWADLRQLVMYEFALFRCHRYATVIADDKTHQMLRAGVERSRKGIRPFFELWPAHI